MLFVKRIVRESPFLEPSQKLVTTVSIFKASDRFDFAEKLIRFGFGELFRVLDIRFVNVYSSLIHPLV